MTEKSEILADQIVKVMDTASLPDAIGATTAVLAGLVGVMAVKTGDPSQWGTMVDSLLSMIRQEIAGELLKYGSGVQGNG